MKLNLVTRRPAQAKLISTSGLVLVVLLIALPKILEPSYQIKAVNLFALILMAGMWNLLAGFGGMVSVGQQAYIGIGAYGLVYIADTLGVNPFLSVILAGAISGLIAIPLSAIVFRLAGGYFAIGTWVLAEIVKLIVTQIGALGGGSGLSLAAFSDTDRLARIQSVYWAGLVAMILILIATYLIMRSKLGLALTAMRDDPVAAGVLGVDIKKFRRRVYVLVAIGFGISGALLTLINLRVQPDDIFSVNYSAIMIFIVVIGGLGTIEGPIVGAIIYFVLQNQLHDYGSWYLIVLGIFGIFVVLLAPNGIWGIISRSRFTFFATKYRVITKKGE